MNEHELRQQLHAAAATINPQPDLVEIELGAGRVRSRRRVATGVVAAMLVAGAGGAGFGIGRSVGDNGDQLVAGSGADDAVTTGTTITTTITTTNANTNTDTTLVGTDEDPPGDPAGTPPITLPANRDSGRDRSGPVPAAESGYFAADRVYYVQEPMTVVYERTLDNGVRVRMQRGQSWGSEEWYGSDWRPAPFCYPTADARVTIDGPNVVDVTGYGWYEELFRGLAAQPVEVGNADGQPMRLLQVQVAPDVTEVAVTWPDGATDRTVPTNGAAVLVVDGLGAYEGYTLEVTDAAGTRTMTSVDLDYYRDPEYRAGCEEPPPALPDAGEQPADPAAAEAAVLERFQLLWDATIADGDKPGDLLDDDTGVDDAIAQIFEGAFAEVAQSATHTIEELVFTSPTEAWFRYGIDTTSGFFGQRYGYATLIDGVWVFPRALVCQDLGLAGGGCEPFVESIYPPSWYERYGDPYSECKIAENGEEVCEYYGSDVGFLPPTTVVAAD